MEQMAGFLRTYSDIINGSTVFPVTMHAAGLVVPASNPKNIRSLVDVINRDDIRVVVNDGNYVGSLTSGTAVWEDVVGPLQDCVLCRRQWESQRSARERCRGCLVQLV